MYMDQCPFDAFMTALCEMFPKLPIFANQPKYHPGNNVCDLSPSAPPSTWDGGVTGVKGWEPTEEER